MKSGLYVSIDEPLVYRLSRQWHSRVAKFGKDNR